MIAEMLERGEAVEGVEVELVFSHGELEAEMADLEVTAIRNGGGPREPFTVSLWPTTPASVDTGCQEWAKKFGAAGGGSNSDRRADRGR
jgi:hypothetical protein